MNEKETIKFLMEKIQDNTLKGLSELAPIKKGIPNLSIIKKCLEEIHKITFLISEK